MNGMITPLPLAQGYQAWRWEAADGGTEAGYHYAGEYDTKEAAERAAGMQQEGIT